MISDNFTEEELDQYGAQELLEEFTRVMDGLLDGGSLNVQVSSNDYMAPEEKKPVIPAGLSLDLEKSYLNNTKEFYYVSSLLILLLVQLNPQNDLRKDLYQFKIAILYCALVSGAAGGDRNNNYKTSDIVFDSNYIKKEKRKITKDEKIFISEVMSYQNTAYNFLAFSVLNFIRFNHHFMREKVNLMQKGLIGLPENTIKDILDAKNKYKNLDLFYDNYVAAAKILDDCKFYYMHLNPQVEKINNSKKCYNYYSILRVLDVKFNDEIVKIRKNCTSNGFLILDITKAIIEDICNKKLAYLIPNISMFEELMKIRNTIREHPFLYHPSNIHFKYGDKALSEIREKFQTTIAPIAGFIYSYSELMYGTIRDAKCRIKYMNNITKDDEIRAKTIMELAINEIEISQEIRDKIKKEVNTVDLKVLPETDLKALNEEIRKKFVF